MKTILLGAMLFTGVAGLSVAVAACSDSSNGGTPADDVGCSGDFSGTWTFSTTACPNKTCKVTQSGCRIELDCNASRLSGTVRGSSLDVMGIVVAGDGRQDLCTGALGVSTVTLTCTPTDQGTCTSTGTCADGVCGRLADAGAD